MPLLYADDVIGWGNARVEDGALVVDVGFERGPPDDPAFPDALAHEVARLAAFLGVRPPGGA